MGADIAIDYKKQDFAEVIADKTDGRGVDVVIDFVGEPYFARNVASLAHGGRMIQVGILGGGGKVTVELEHILYRHLQIIGTVMKSRTQPEKHAMIKRFREHWLDRFDGAGSLSRSLIALSRCHRLPMPIAGWSHPRTLGKLS